MDVGIKEYWDMVQKKRFTLDEAVNIIREWIEKSEDEKINFCPFLSIEACEVVCESKWNFIKDCYLKTYKDDNYSFTTNTCPCLYLENLYKDNIFILDNNKYEKLINCPITKREILEYVYEMLVEGVKRQFKRDNGGI